MTTEATDRPVMTPVLEFPRPRYEVMRAPETKTARVLPSPPEDSELGRYEHREVALLSGVSAISIACLAVSQWRFAELNPWLLLVLPALIFTMVYYAISLITNLRSRNFDLGAHRQLVADWRPTTHPSVDILLPICNEGLDVLNNTWRYVRALADTYRGEVVVHVLDDGDSRSAEAAARDCGFRYSVRPERGWMKKAGNLRHGFQNSTNEYLAIFDADFCPRPDFLDHLLPYLEADASLGIVQSPQFFRSSKRQSLMERGAGAIQELFYRLVQVSRDSLGGAICVGSNAVYRRDALDAIGGTILIDHSEDVFTGFEIGQAGWELRYIPVPLATGVCPQSPDSFLTQQYRWCAGSMSMMMSSEFRRAKLSFGARLCYISGFLHYLHTAAFVFLTPAIPLLLIAVEPRHVAFVNYVWILPSTLYSMVIFPMWNRIRYGPSAVMAKYLYGWAHLFAVLDTFRGGVAAWEPTGARSSRTQSTRMWWAIGTWGFLTGCAWLGGAIWRGSQLGYGNWILMIAFASEYAGIILFAFWARHEAART